MNTLTVTLDWPDPSLSPNARVDRRALYELKRGARHTGRILTLEAIGGGPLPFTKRDKLKLVVVYCPPDERGRDLFDNAPASAKSLVDGVFDALEVNDRQIVRVESEWGEPCDRGRIVFTLARLRS